MVYLLLELIWTIIKVNYEIIRGMWRVLVPPEPKDVRGEIVLVSDVFIYVLVYFTFYIKNIKEVFFFIKIYLSDIIIKRIVEYKASID